MYSNIYLLYLKDRIIVNLQRFKKPNLKNKTYSITVFGKKKLQVPLGTYIVLFNDPVTQFVISLLRAFLARPIA